MAIKVCVPLAEGFEEIEAVTVIDVLRRAGLEVTTVGVGRNPVLGSHGIAVIADQPLEEALMVLWDAVILPGGMPGSTGLRGSTGVIELLQRTHGAGGTVGAICAAPIALEAAGLLRGVRATSYPTFRDQLPGADYVEDAVVQDGAVVTSRGPGTAMEFALSLVERFTGGAAAEELRKALLAAS